MKATREKYYAIRIGHPKFHSCYFMLGDDDATPALFTDLESAKAYMPKEPNVKVVTVEILEKAK